MILPIGIFDLTPYMVISFKTVTCLEMFVQNSSQCNIIVQWSDMNGVRTIDSRTNVIVEYVAISLLYII